MGYVNIMHVAHHVRVLHPSYSYKYFMHFLHPLSRLITSSTMFLLSQEYCSRPYTICSQIFPAIYTCLSNILTKQSPPSWTHVDLLPKYSHVTQGFRPRLTPRPCPWTNCHRTWSTSTYRRLTAWIYLKQNWSSLVPRANQWQPIKNYLSNLILSRLWPY